MVMVISTKDLDGSAMEFLSQFGEPGILTEGVENTETRVPQQKEEMEYDLKPLQGKKVSLTKGGSSV